MNSLVTVIMCILLFTGCNTDKKNTGNFPEEKIVDLAYGSYPSSKMDLYLPAGRTPETPFVILIHGGGWVSGDKKNRHSLQDSLLAHHIASASINYRFADSSQIHYSELLADIDSAISYCIKNADKAHTRRDNFILNGASAGAHLSLLYGYTTTRKISAIIAECPPTDFTDTAVLNYDARIGLLPMINKMAGANSLRGKPVNDLFKEISPVFHVKDIPTLIIHGTADSIVPYSQAVVLDNKLSSKHVRHKLLTLQGAGHDLNLQEPATKKMVYYEIVDWIWKYQN